MAWGEGFGHNDVIRHKARSTDGHDHVVTPGRVHQDDVPRHNECLMHSQRRDEGLGGRID